jgi:hypothetical protein
MFRFRYIQINVKRLTKSYLACLLTSFGIINCTGQIPGSFRYLQQEQTFSATQGVNTKIDLLWVVDNSSSMDVHQQKLRAGFKGFSDKYLKPTWDIRVGVITTDAYLANSAYSGYLANTIPGSVGYTSSYLSGLSWLGIFQNPTWDPALVDTADGSFPHGLTYNALNPLWGPNYARMLPGIHDGPMTAFCFEAMPYFLRGATLCNLRDNPADYSGTEGCLRPNEGIGESSYSQCINTLQNDSVRSGRAIISTVPPQGIVGDSSWTQRLNDEFVINASVGSSGSGSERGLSSLLQLLEDNESSDTSFFRPDSLRGIIFLSDEDDQSIDIPLSVPAGFSPDWGYLCDQASLLAMNGGSALIDGVNGLCCSNPGNNCRYGENGISCPTKTVEGYGYKKGICVDESLLISVGTIKEQLDRFFDRLDAEVESSLSVGSKNYFIVAIAPINGTSVQAIQTSRDDIDNVIGGIKVLEADRGDRYIELGNQVGNGSLSLDIGTSDYSPVLDAIGKEIVEKKSTFTLSRAPTNSEEMIITILHEDGSVFVVPSSEFIISGKSIVFTSQDFVLSLSSTDRVSINYQPKTAY